MQPPRYREEQRFRQVWLWLIIFAIAGFFWYALIRQIFLQQPVGDNPMPNGGLILVWLLCGLGIPCLFFFTKLITEVRQDGLYIRFIPFHFSFQKIAFDQLESYDVRTYRPIWEYGGWGIRFGPKGWAYNVSGNRGVQLELTGGKRVLIGSQRPDELRQAIHLAIQAKTTS